MAEAEKAIGQDHIKEYFVRARHHDQLSHAYILAGEKGMGHSDIARALAMSLQCEQQGDNACGNCHSCIQALADSQPDIRIINTEKSSLGVDIIREQLVGDAAIKPYQGPYKIYIVEDAEKMTIQAQNALLKTLEEPPAYVIILLLTDNDRAFLPTILSRCITLALKPLSDEAILNYLLKDSEIEESQAKIYTSLARGNLGKAVLYIKDEGFKQVLELMISLLKNIDNLSTVQMLAVFDKIKESGVPFETFLDLLLVWFRDVLLFKATKDMDLLIFSNEYFSIRNFGEHKTFNGIENILKAIDKAKVRLKANVNFATTMELLAWTIKEN